MKTTTLVPLKIICFIILGLLSYGMYCDKPQQEDSPVVARVGKTILTLNDLNKSIPPEYSGSISQKQRINYVKQWIDTELLYQEAIRKKLLKEKEIIKRLDRMKKDLLSAEMISRNASSLHTPKISEDAITEYYEQHKDSFIREYDVVKYVEIIVEDLKTGWAVRNAVTTTNFLDLAKEYSIVPIQDPNAVPYVPLSSLPAEIADVIFTIRANGTTSPIKLDDGVHIIRVLDKQKAGSPCLLEEVREELIGTLSAQSQKKDIETFLTELRQKSDYSFNHSLLTQDSIDLPMNSGSTPEQPGSQNANLNPETGEQ